MRKKKKLAVFNANSTDSGNLVQEFRNLTGDSVDSVLNTSIVIQSEEVMIFFAADSNQSGAVPAGWRINFSGGDFGKKKKRESFFFYSHDGEDEEAMRSTKCP